MHAAGLNSISQCYTKLPLSTSKPHEHLTNPAIAPWSSKKKKKRAVEENKGFAIGRGLKRPAQQGQPWNIYAFSSSREETRGISLAYSAGGLYWTAHCCFPWIPRLLPQRMNMCSSYTRVGNSSVLTHYRVDARVGNQSPGLLNERFILVAFLGTDHTRSLSSHARFTIK